MADFIDYQQLKEDFKQAITNANLGFATILLDAMDREFTIQNMPLLDIRIKKVVPEAITNQTYYTACTVECEICTFDLTNRAEAAKIRDNLANALQRFVKDNPRFSSLVNTILVGQGNFGTGESKAEGAFVAGAVLEFLPQIYTE